MQKKAAILSNILGRHVAICPLDACSYKKGYHKGGIKQSTQKI